MREDRCGVCLGIVLAGTCRECRFFFRTSKKVKDKDDDGREGERKRQREREKREVADISSVH